MKYFLISIFAFTLPIILFSDTFACDLKDFSGNAADFYLKKNECHDFAFRFETETFVEITAGQKGVDLQLRLFENGGEIKSADSENMNSGYEFLSFIAKPNAAYTVRAEWVDDAKNFIGNEGFYTLEKQSRKTADSDRTYVAKLDETKAIYDAATAKRLRSDADAANKYDSAIAAYKLFPQSKQTKYRLLLANYFLGVSYNSAKKYSSAIPVLESAIPSAVENQDFNLENLIYKELSIAYFQTGEYEKSGITLDKAIAGFERLKAEKIGDIQSLPSAYIARAQTFVKTNNAENAVALLENVRVNFKTPVAENMLATIKLADIYYNLGNIGKAEETLLTLNITDETSEYIKGLFNKVSGKIYINKDKNKSLTHFSKANAYLAENESELNEIKLFTGNTHFYAKDFTAAKNLYEESKLYFERQNDKYNLAQILNNLGVISYSQNDKPTAISECQYALALNIETNSNLNKARNLINLMYFTSETENSPTAIFYGKWAINTIESVKYEQIGNLEAEIRDNFQESFNDAFRMLSELLIKEGRIGEAEQVLRFIKEKEYRDYVRGGQKTGTIEFTPVEKEMLEAAKNKFQKKPQSKTFSESTDDRESLSPIRQLIENLKKQNFNVSELLFISTIVNKDSVNIIATNESAEKVFTVKIPREDLSKLVFNFRQAVSSPEKDSRAEGEKLYDILVRPLEKEFLSPPVKKIVWSLDGVLRYVSMPALFDGKNYLVENFASVQMSLAIDDKILKPKVSNPPAIGLASSKAFENLSDLPVAKNELDCIFEDDKKLIINSSCAKGIIKGKKIADEDFTKTAFENALKNFKLIHLTSHFVLQSGDSSKSFLLLGGGNDRKYTMKSFSEQELKNVETLIMSACDTANFSFDGSEFESFATMAQKQGAKSVIGTMWSVADHSTSKFMTEFYRSYELKNQDKAVALQNSQIYLLNSKKYSHPFYWASFILFGNWK